MCTPPPPPAPMIGMTRSGISSIEIVHLARHP
jgi:hypothetical protein